MSSLIYWWRQLWCKHEWELNEYMVGHYDYEFWETCTKCGKERDK